MKLMSGKCLSQKQSYSLPIFRTLRFIAQQHFAKPGVVAGRAVLTAWLLLLFSNFSQTVASDFIDTVLVGNPGNAAKTVLSDDTRFFKSGSFGSVPQAFRIGTTEVTNDQYVSFLSAVASVDTHSLFNPSMGTDARGGILRTGTSGNYSYSSKTSFGDKPVNFVGIWDTLRFTNWLHNGMPNGDQDNATTEEGAYSLEGVTSPRGVDVV